MLFCTKGGFIMKKFFKFFCKLSTGLTFCLVLCFTLSSHVKASTLSSAKEFLLEAGTPVDIVNTLSEDQINRMYQNFIASNADVTFVTQTSSSEKNILRNPISPNDLDFNTLYYNLSYEGQVFQVQAYMTYKWKNLPTVAKTDTFIVSWDKDLFTLADAGVHCYADTFVGTITFKDQYKPDVSTQNALGFYLPLSDASIWNATSYYGNVDIFFNTSENLSPNDTCNIISTYTHLTNENESLNMDVDGNQINISGTTAFDTLQKNIIYKANDNIIEE